VTIDHNDLQRSLGRIEGKQSAMEERVGRFEKLVSDGFTKMDTALERIDTRLAEIEAKESERKGSWRILAVLGGVVGAALTAFIEYLRH
jgi:hypothetical protein